MWSTVISGESEASPAEVYALLASPDTWPEWDASIERIELSGQLAAGTRGVMVLRGGQELPFQITWLEPGAGFTSETPVPGAGIVVDGPDEVAAEAGTGVSADFPQVIAALAAMAEQRPAAPSR